MADPKFLLHAESLLSKWGFGDGDALSDWWWDTFEYDPDWDFHVVLFELVKEHLVPEMERKGHRVELVFIHTIHNPVRAERLNGEEIDWYGDHATLPIAIAVTRDQILAAVAVTEQGENR